MSKSIKIFFLWILNTQLKATGITWYVNPEDHPDTCICSRKCVRRGMSHNATMHNFALVRKTIRYYKCKECGQGFYSWKKRKICKRFSCYLSHNRLTRY